MREIKFRGKRIDNGEWVYGTYAYFYGLFDDLSYPSDHWIFTGLENQCYQIDINTLGQYTGFLDKKEKEIYKGDILKTEAKIHPNCEITFTQGVFGLIGGNSSHYPLIYFSKGGSSLSGDIIIPLEIIGNIYENPELLNK